MCNRYLTVCHRPDGLEVDVMKLTSSSIVCHRPDGLEVVCPVYNVGWFVCHRPDGLEETSSHS